MLGDSREKAGPRRCCAKATKLVRTGMVARGTTPPVKVEYDIYLCETCGARMAKVARLTALVEA
jgi:hypothetical protein